MWAGVPALPPILAKTPPAATEALAAAAAKAAAASAVKEGAADAAHEGAAPPRSGPPSCAGIAVPSADDLRKELFAVYRPDQEPSGLGSQGS